MTARAPHAEFQVHPAVCSPGSGWGNSVCLELLAAGLANPICGPGWSEHNVDAHVGIPRLSDYRHNVVAHCIDGGAPGIRWSELNDNTPGLGEFNAPENPEIRVDTAKVTAEGAADAIVQYLKEKGRLTKA